MQHHGIQVISDSAGSRNRTARFWGRTIGAPYLWVNQFDGAVEAGALDAGAVVELVEAAGALLVALP